MPRPHRYRTGQRWRFDNPLKEFQSALVVASAKPDSLYCVVYVRFDRASGVQVSPSLDGVVLGVGADDLDRCVTDLLEEGVELPPWWRYGRPCDLNDPPKNQRSYSGKEVSGALHRALDTELKEEEARRLRAAAPSRDEVLRLLHPWREAHKRPTWKPIIEPADGPLTGSKFSGAPWLAEGEEWPCCSDCDRPMQLFLQLNLAALPDELHGRFGEGLLQMFYCTANDEECHGGDFLPFGSGKLLRLVRPDGPNKQRPIPITEGYFPARAIVGWERRDDYPDGGEHDELGVRYQFNWELHLVDVLGPDGLLIKNLETEIIEIIARALSGDELGGWPDWYQGVEYPNCPRCGRRMEMVFQLDSYDNLPYMYGDDGTGHITQCPDHKDVVTFAWACG